MKNDTSKSSIFLLLKPIKLVFLLVIFTQCFSNNKNAIEEQKSSFTSKILTKQELISPHDKHKGAHVFGYLDSTNLQPFIHNNFNWITIVSYSDQKDFDSPTLVYYRGDSLQMAQRDSTWKSQIDIAHKSGFKVFLKPHIWLSSPTNGKWRSDIFPANEKNWKLWQKNYREFILLYAKIAQQNDVELFCIGAELSRLSIEKSDFWINLIQDVRSIYSGQLTYAANWNKEFEAIKFWDELDFIGIQAYFPLVTNEDPSVEQISKGWNKYLPAIASIYKKYNRKILFTEMGYKSTANSAIKPWEWIENASDSDHLLSIETQANCYEAFFKTVWNKEWFAGVHIWQMRSDYKDVNRKNNLDFTPQGKQAEKVIAKGFE